MISETSCTIQTGNLNFGTHCQVNMVHSRLDFVNRRNSLAMLANPPVGPLSSYYGKCKSLPLPLFWFSFFFPPSQVEENFIKREKQAKKTTAKRKAIKALDHLKNNLEKKTKKKKKKKKGTALQPLPWSKESAMLLANQPTCTKDSPKMIKP